MKIRPVRHNIYFILLLGIVAAALIGCKTTEEKKKAKEASSLRMHLEVNSDGTPYNSYVPIYRAKPIQVNVNRDAFLDEGYMVKAEVVEVDDEGGFGIRVKFDKHGTQVLENITTGHRGQRIAIFSRFTETRWLAAPRITRRITDGTFVFTPDASREEADRIVNGLNNVIKKLQKPFVF